MNKVQIKVDKPANDQYRGVGLAFFRMVDRQRVRSGKKLFAMWKYLDGGSVSIYARSSIYPAGNLVQIKGGELVVTIWGVIFDPPGGGSISNPYYGELYDIDLNTTDDTTTIDIYPGGDSETGYYRYAQLSTEGGYACRHEIGSATFADCLLYKDNSLITTYNPPDFNTIISPKRPGSYTPQNHSYPLWWSVDQSSGVQHLIIREVDNAATSDEYTYLVQLSSTNAIVSAVLIAGPVTFGANWQETLPSYVVTAKSITGSIAWRRRLEFRDKSALTVLQTVDLPAPSIQVMAMYEVNGVFYLYTYDNPGWRIIKIDPADSWSQTEIYANTAFVILASTNSFMTNSIWVNPEETRIILTYTLNSSSQSRLAELNYDDVGESWGTPTYGVAPEQYFKIQELTTLE